MAIRAILFDWGDTLMRNNNEYSGPMVTWTRVEAIPQAAETLRALQQVYRLGVATDADVSTAEQIRAALDRCQLGQYFEKIYCARGLGIRKLSPAYFPAILADLGLPPAEVVMVGDHFEADVLGAVRQGMKAVWFQEGGSTLRRGRGYTTIHALPEIEAALAEVAGDPTGDVADPEEK